jgi:hypothetical protein
LPEHEAVRNTFRGHDIKKRRRVAVGDRVTLVSEDRDTVLYQSLAAENG